MRLSTPGMTVGARRYGAAATTALAFLGAYAGGIDRKVALDQSGIWNRNVQFGLEYAVIATTVGGSLWLGNDNELGHTFWQTADATAISAVAAQGMRYAFGRQRPNAGQGPNQWFSGGRSFPSGEVTLQASFVTPFIVNYGRRDPWVWGLELLSLYDSIARVKSQAHLAD
ncbi:hypothetical protein B0G81_7757 [Paraburkholderia sp. BL6665CI2N2]|uniref:phosphatase PAP2 family protein n=1 Tax=Paraburkholderia sp. BL6665CI2N2 TaxID=1938806 RepID=UPI0010EB4CCE|nr:phosphatase PAP2 family protein [Paraburkholderia sp. BL6665CI2N2]TDY16680.1 hypothetical protein B0G81_7757 [Paraburkholderia sp. BL6665CI2N2]